MFSFRRDSKEKNSENNKAGAKNMKNKKPESQSTKLKNVIDDEVGKPTLYSFRYRLMSKRVGFMYLRFSNFN